MFYFRRPATAFVTVLLVAIFIVAVRNNSAAETGSAVKTLEQSGTPAQPGALIKTATWAETEKPGFVPGRVLVKFSPGVTAEQKLAFLSRIGAKSLKVYSIPAGLELIELPAEVKVQQAREYFSGLQEIEYSEPDFVYHADAIPDDVASRPERTGVVEAKIAVGDLF